MSIIIKEKYNLPQTLKTQEDLDIVLNTFYSTKLQTSDFGHLRFGQFIYNIYNIEVGNSYNIKYSQIVYELILDYIKTIN